MLTRGRRATKSGHITTRTPPQASSDFSKIHKVAGTSLDHSAEHQGAEKLS